MFFLLASSLQVTNPIYNPGFFSVFNTVLGALDEYDSQKEGGFEVNFGKEGLYYDDRYGPNWWNYYFEPIQLDFKEENKRYLKTYQKIIFSMNAQFNMTPTRGCELLSKYVHLKRPIQKKVDDFVKENFEGHTVIGLHYRGTDKNSEAPGVSYEEVKSKIEHEFDGDQKLFVATDDANFLSYIQKAFPGIVIAQNAIRSSDQHPVHIHEKVRNYEKGEEALLDCVLLSKCQKLYKMASNLSDTSLKFNPSIPVVHLNQSFSENTHAGKYNAVKVINTILFHLDAYEKGECSGVNTTTICWWDRYFYPVEVGYAENQTFRNFEFTTLGLKNLFEMPKERAHQLFQKYVRFRPHLLEKVDRILKKLQGKEFLGVDYEEIISPFPSDYVTIDSCLEAVMSLKEDMPVFFVSRNASFVEAAKKTFPDAVFFTFSEVEDVDFLVSSLVLSHAKKVYGIASDRLPFIEELNPDCVVHAANQSFLLME